MAQEEANDVKDEVVTEDTATESSAVEDTQDQSQEDEIMQSLGDDDESTDDNTSEEQEESKEETEVESEDETDEETEVPEEPKTKADQRKEQLNGEIRDLVSEKNQLKEQIEQLNNQVYQPQTKDELVEEGYSEEEARVMALEQKLELKDYNEQVINAQVGLAQEAQRIEREFPIFNPDSPDYDQEIASQAAELLEESLITDPNTGQIVGSHNNMYKLYKSIAGAYQKSSVSGQVKGQKEAVRRMASVEAPSSAKRPETTKKDPLLDILASDDD
jgi:chromosome segregation ATPase